MFSNKTLFKQSREMCGCTQCIVDILKANHATRPDDCIAAALLNELIDASKERNKYMIHIPYTPVDMFDSISSKIPLCGEPYAVHFTTEHTFATCPECKRRLIEERDTQKLEHRRKNPGTSRSY